MQQETVAIIPARAGSRRCPNKNIALFKGMPLIAYTIEQAVDARIFNNIVVSSNDAKVIQIASEYDVLIDNREANLATDKAPVVDVIRNIIAKYGLYSVSIVGLLQVTAPLRQVDDILAAYKLFCSSEQTRSVVSVTHNESPIELSWRIENQHLVPCFSGQENASARKQDYEPTYRWNDAVIFDLAENFLDPKRNLFGKFPIPYVMPPERSIYIDYEFQLKLAQLMGNYI
jgi:N-acylneuraminate cytidylyltransferase/CMP-N,N'-diacetyllegionaminic acid synthase